MTNNTDEGQEVKKIQYPVVLGWYSGSSQKEAMYDPGLVPCPYCGITPNYSNVRTLSLMAGDREPMLSVFYRCHSKCHEDNDQQSIDDFVMTALETMREPKEDNK